MVYRVCVPCVFTFLVFSAFVNSGIAQSCNAPISIQNVVYKGKVSGNDQIEVQWITNTTTTCVGASGVKIDVKVTRPSGRTDTGTQSVDTQGATGIPFPSGSLQKTIVTIPRGLVELDPKSYAVTLTVTKSRPTLGPNGTGNSVGVTKHTNPVNSTTLNQEKACAPKLAIGNINRLTNTQNSELLQVFFTSGPGSPANCLTLHNTMTAEVHVRYTGILGPQCHGVQSINISSNEFTITAPCSVSTTNSIADIEVKINRGVTGTGMNGVTATKQGNF